MSDFPGAGTIHKKVAFTPKQYASLSLVYPGTVIYMQAQDHTVIRDMVSWAPSSDPV